MVTFASECSKFRDCPKISEQCTITLLYTFYRVYPSFLEIFEHIRSTKTVSKFIWKHTNFGPL